MEFSTSNQFTIARDSVSAQYAAHLQAAGIGASEGLFCVVSQSCLGDAAQQAFINSAKSLGYGQNGCFFVTLVANRENIPTLAGDQLFELIEGIDPLALVVADNNAAAALQTAYSSGANKVNIPLGKPFRLLGRSAVAFNDFEGMLNASANKQKAWALLKQLPKIEA